MRSMLGARGITCVIGAEHHASLLGPIGSAFLSLDIWVDTADAEDAAALLRDLRENNPGELAAEVDPGVPDDEREGDGEWVPRAHAILAGAGSSASRGAAVHGDPDDGPGELAERPTGELAERPDDDVAAIRARVYQRRRAIVALLSGTFLTFGTAHIFTGAWVRGLALAALEVFGLLQISAGNPLGGVAVAAAIATDVVGTAWRLRAAAQAALPPARLTRPAPKPELPPARIESP
ncbi:MAG TPA: hypothetical protein VH165_17155 [Kofleriaceae bacterium]|nr:hypothetical protein [Kofleriaceae bacterium]